MCDNRPFNMAVLDHVGVAGSNPLQAVTFVENHDTDRSEPIFQNKMLAYAYILTSEGYPCVFYKDYSTDKFCFGLKAEIDNLIFIHEQIADGGTLQRFKDFDVFAYERIAGAHLLVGLHNNSNAARTITVFTGFGANVGLHDYSGHAGDVRTDGSGQVTITIPRNTNGLGYVCYSRLGIGSAFQIQTHTVTQAFEGAQDLDIKPAATGHPVEIGRIWCEANQLIRGVLTFDAKDWTDATTLTLELLGPNGESLDRKVYARAEEGNALDKQANATGWHAFRIQAANTPPANPRPGYTLKVTYTAPQKL
jgi:alpha-amylase